MQGSCQPSLSSADNAKSRLVLVTIRDDLRENPERQAAGASAFVKDDLGFTV